jgi:hypothetical protein
MNMRFSLPALLLGVILLTLVCGGAFAQSKVGTTAAPFLNIAVGARALGMGGAFTATADDATALHWNPAGIAGINRFTANLVHTNWLVDLKFDVVGAVLPVGEAGVLGAQVVFLSMPDQEITTNQQAEQDGTGLFYSAGSTSMGVTFARAFTDRFKLGLTGKYIREWIWHESASTMALDLGSIYTTPFHDMRMGVAITNFGGRMSMSGRDLSRFYDVDPIREGNNTSVTADLSTDKWPLPLTMRFGLAGEVIHTAPYRVTLAADAVHPNDNRESINLGAEGAYREMFMLRVGYKSLFLPDSEEGITGGAGLRVSTRGGPAVGFDFAYEDFGRFDAVYKYSLNIWY